MRRQVIINFLMKQYVMQNDPLALWYDLDYKAYLSYLESQSDSRLLESYLIVREIEGGSEYV